MRLKAVHMNNSGWSGSKTIGILEFRVRKDPKMKLWRAQVKIGGKWFNSLDPNNNLVLLGTRHEIWKYLEYAHGGELTAK